MGDDMVRIFSHHMIEGAISLRQSNPKTHDSEHAALSERVRRWRRDRNMSQADLASRAGFARSTLSKIENGQLSPTFEILLKLSHGFGVDIADLLSAETVQSLPGRMSVDRGLPSESIDYPNNRLFPLAAGFKDKRFQCFIADFTCTSLEDFGEWNQHDTEDMLYVLSGTLEFHSEGYETLTLEAGQSVYFDGRMRHACISVQDAVCRCLYIFAPNGTAHE